MLLSLLRRAIERAGYAVIPAVSGVEMIRVLGASRPDLIP
jgi:hypothetical protein